jgi:hypothetical protein
LPEFIASLTARICFGKVYVMQTKLTLRIDDALVRKAKSVAKMRGKSVSLMMSEYIDSFGRDLLVEHDLPPVTSSLLGILKDKSASEDDYKKHLLEKYG